MKAKSKLIDEFMIKLTPKYDGVNYGINVTAWDHVYRLRSMGLRDASLADKTFTITGLPSKQVLDCYKTDLKDLKPTTCVGDVQLGPVKKRN